MRHRMAHPEWGRPMSNAPGVQIDPIRIYDDVALYDALGISSRTLSRARCRSELRFTRKGNRTLYVGQWVLDWLTKTAPESGRGQE
jgi:hypothetical protein